MLLKYFEFRSLATLLQYYSPAIDSLLYTRVYSTIHFL